MTSNYYAKITCVSLHNERSVHGQWLLHGLGRRRGVVPHGARVRERPRFLQALEVPRDLVNLLQGVDILAEHLPRGLAQRHVDRRRELLRSGIDGSVQVPRDDPLKVPRRHALSPPLNLVPTPRKRQGVKNRWHEHVLVRQVPKRILPLGLPVETVQERLVYLTRVDAHVHRGGVEEQTEENRLTPARASRLRCVGQHPVRRVHAPHQQGLRLDRRHRHRVLGHVQHHVGDQHRA